MKRTLIIQPFNQRVAWLDPCNSYQKSSIDRLDKDLKFKRTEFVFEGTPEEALEEAISEGIVNSEGWILMKDVEFYQFSDVWSQAVKLLGNGNIYNPLKPHEKQYGQGHLEFE